MVDEENPYLQMLHKAQAQYQKDTSGTTIPERSLLYEYGLDNLDCPRCNNRGSVWVEREGILYSCECSCMNTRRSIRSIERSGMKDLLNRYTFDNYQTPDMVRSRIKVIAEMYADSDQGWFFIVGQSGSGKTHICSAICKRMADRGKNIKYMLWRDDIVRLKAVVNNNEEYQKIIKPLKEVRVLYIDDFLKGKITDADLNVAMELINARYNNDRLMTIISSELPIQQIFSIDEAVGGRILEKSKGFRLEAPKENWRLK